MEDDVVREVELLVLEIELDAIVEEEVTAVLEGVVKLEVEVELVGVGEVREGEMRGVEGPGDIKV